MLYNVNSLVFCCLLSGCMYVFYGISSVCSVCIDVFYSLVALHAVFLVILSAIPLPIKS